MQDSEIININSKGFSLIPGPDNIDRFINIRFSTLDGDNESPWG